MWLAMPIAGHPKNNGCKMQVGNPTRKTIPHTFFIWLLIQCFDALFCDVPLDALNHFSCNVEAGRGFDSLEPR